MSFYDPQNNPDLNKPKQKMDYPIRYDDSSSGQRERGGCLTVFLIVYALLTVLALFLVISVMSDLDQSRLSSSARSQLQCISWVAVATVLAQLVCIAGLWNFKRWGYQGLLVLMGINIVLNLCSADIVQLVGNVVVLGILYYVVNPIQHESD